MFALTFLPRKSLSLSNRSEGTLGEGTLGTSLTN